MQFTKHLESELESTRHTQETRTRNVSQSSTNNASSTTTLQLSRGLSEMKKKTVQAYLNKLEAEQSKRKMELVQVGSISMCM